MLITKIGVLGSGGGTNCQAIIDACLPLGVLFGWAEVSVIISNNSKAGILERGRQAAIPVYHMSSRTHGADLDRCLLAALRAHEVELVVLAGYMKKLGPTILAAFPRAVLNIHPAIDLARFGGEGFYGRHVHAAVLAAGDKVSGATVHLVNNEYDRGPILAQAFCPVLPGDTPETLGARVLKLEHLLLPMVIRGWIEKRWD